MPRWEYVVFPSSPTPAQIEQELNTWGAGGWELVSWNEGVFVLKREREEFR